MTNEEILAKQRVDMVRNQLAARGIVDTRVVAAMRDVPRHLFVPAQEQNRAYEDSPLPIGYGQTISQPYIVAYMLQSLSLSGKEKTLEIGTGSGYQAALLGKLCKEVHTIERHATLVEGAKKVLSELGFQNVQIHQGDGTKGLRKQAPFDAVIVAAGAPVVPQPLLDQLAEGGRLIMPVGDSEGQRLQFWVKRNSGFHHEELVAVAFVPLIGEHGWPDDSGFP
ncbi:MAG: protein-L-isoaspartate(D-aspartate) O-methyltransferase [Anaerolineales bacterium]